MGDVLTGANDRRKGIQANEFTNDGRVGDSKRFRGVHVSLPLQMNLRSHEVGRECLEERIIQSAVMQCKELLRLFMIHLTSLWHGKDLAPGPIPA